MGLAKPTMSRPNTPKSPSNNASMWYTVAALAIIVAIACVLRFAALDRIPPGPFRDEAFNGLNASRIWDLGDIQPFYATNSGREGMIVVLVAAAIRLAGHTSLALRSIGALVGTLTVLAGYGGFRLFFGAEQRGKLVALLATASMAVCYWHVHFSRLAFRAILVPLFALATLGVFVQAWRTNRLVYYVASGLLLGLSLYTYLSARFLPILLLIFLLMETGLAGVRLLRDRTHSDVRAPSGRRQRMIGVLLLLSMATIVALPLGLYFVRSPEQLGFRAADVSIFSPQANPLGKGAAELTVRNAFTTLRMFYDRGDANPRHGIPYRPVLDPLLTALFTVGLVVGITRLRSAAIRLLFLWLALMLLPVVLSIDAPNNLRALGALPAVCAFIGIGATWIAEAIARTVRRCKPSVGPASMIGKAGFWAGLELILILVFTGTLTAHTYFVRWTQLPETFSSLDDSWRHIAETVLDITKEFDVYLPYEMFTNPVVHYLLYDRYPSLQAPSEPITSANLRQPKAIFSADLPPQGPFVLLTDGASPQAFALQSIGETQRLQMYSTFGPRSKTGLKILDSQGRDVAVVLPLSASDVALFPDRQGPAYPLVRRFANGVQLIGYSLEPSTLPAGGQFILTLYWQTDRLLEDEFEVFVHLVDRNSAVRSQGNSLPLAGSYTGTLWSPGEIVPDPHTIIIPADLAPGKVRFEVGLANPGLQKRLPIIDAEGREIGDQATLGASLLIPNAKEAPAQPSAPLALTSPAPPVSGEISFGKAISLANYHTDGEPQPGEKVRLGLEWHAQGRVDEDYTVFVHLVDRAGNIVVQHDQQPQGGTNPTSWWTPNEKIVEEIELAIPVNAPLGPYTYRVRSLPGLERNAFAV